MSKKSRLDLLVRVRYLNPLPPPPFPPKLFHIPTDINRLGEPSYLNHLVASTPLPMLVDSEMGMPLDLNAYEGVWNGSDKALCPAPTPNQTLHPDDIALLGPLNNTAALKGPEKPPAASEVSWMRTSNLFMRKTGTRRRDAADFGDRTDTSVDASEAAQLMAIDKTFTDLTDQELENIRHPDSKKRSLRVVESYDILPDDEAWANSYIMIRFPERPSAATASNPSARASSPRLARAVLRPIKEDDQQIMEYLLPPEDDIDRLDDTFDRAIEEDQAEQIRILDEQLAGNPEIDKVFPNVHYERVRTYEVVVQTNPTKEVLVSFQEDSEAADDKDDMFDESPRKRRKGVYYKDIHMRTLLRKTRAKRRGEIETKDDLWKRTRVGYRVPDMDEATEREELKSVVTDPSWVNEELRKIHGGGDAALGQGEAIDEDEVNMVAEADVDEDDDP